MTRNCEAYLVKRISRTTLHASRFTNMALLMLLLILPGQSEAASEVVTLTVTIKRISVAVSSGTVAFGAVADGAIVQTSEANDVTVTNDGNVAEDFTLALSESGPWSPGAAPGPDVFVLSGLFVGDADAPTGVHFNLDDVIATGEQTADGAVFGDAAFAANGAGVPAGGANDLWLEFKAPTSSTVFTQQAITVTVGAVAS